MKSYLETSLLYSLISVTLKFYISSRLKRIVDTIIRWYDNSALCRRISYFFQREPVYRYTLSYRLLAKIGARADHFAGSIRSFYIHCRQSSIVYNIAAGIRDESADRSYLVLTTAIAAFIAGYSSFITFKGVWNIGKMANMLLLGILCVILLIVKDRWKYWMKDSVVYKLYNYIFE